MSTAAAETLSEVEVLRRQAEMTQAVLRRNVDGLTQEESLIQPHPGGNCLNWIVGHLLVTYEGILPMLGQEPVMGKEALKRYARGTPPLQDPAESLELRELMTAWDEAAQRFQAGLAGLTPEALDRPASQGPGDGQTVRSFLALISFHQAYHAGQTGILRRIAGKEGAIP